MLMAIASFVTNKKERGAMKTTAHKNILHPQHLFENTEAVKHKCTQVEDYMSVLQICLTFEYKAHCGIIACFVMHNGIP